MNPNNNLFFTILAKFGWLGNWLFFLIALIECVPVFGAFFPGGTMVSIASFFAAQGYFNVFDIAIFAALGAIAGDYLGYSLGRWGSDWLRRKRIIRPELTAKGEAFFKKYGPLSIFWGRFIGATRAIVPFVAGSSGMSSRRFLLWNLVSALVWAAYNVAVGYFAGNIISRVIKNWSHELGLALAFMAAAGLIYWLVKKQGRNLVSYFEARSARFTTWLLANPWFVLFSRHYPVSSEFFETKKGQERIFAGLLLAALFLAVYALTLIMDLI